MSFTPTSDVNAGSIECHYELRGDIYIENKKNHTLEQYLLTLQGKKEYDQHKYTMLKRVMELNSDKSVVPE